jgi:hypothetical protein
MVAHGRTLALLLLAGAVACGEGLEGTYRLNGAKPTIIDLHGSDSGDGLVGVVTESGDARQRKLLGKPVLVLETADETLGGRINAYHARASEDPRAWLPLERCERRPNGDLRCTVALAEGATMALVYARAEAAPAEDGRPATGLAGDWEDPGGGVVHYVRYRDSYVGQIIRLSPWQRGRGYQVAEEVARLRAEGDGTYRGTAKVRPSSGRRRWEPFEVTVEGDTLRSTRRPAGGSAVTSTARRLASDGQAPIVPIETGGDADLQGLWRASHGALTRYTAQGNLYVGRVAKLSPELEGYGFVVGEESIRLTRKDRLYKGKVKVKRWGGRETWWDPIAVTVVGDSMKYLRQSRQGPVQGRATRVVEEP